MKSLLPPATCCLKNSDGTKAFCWKWKHFKLHSPTLLETWCGVKKLLSPETDSTHDNVSLTNLGFSVWMAYCFDNRVIRSSNRPEWGKSSRRGSAGFITMQCTNHKEHSPFLWNAACHCKFCSSRGIIKSETVISSKQKYTIESKLQCSVLLIPLYMLVDATLNPEMSIVIDMKWWLK